MSPPIAAAGPATRSVTGPVLFFDGECGLCNRLVRFLLRLDRGGHLHFAPLQGSAAQAYLHTHGLPTEEFDTLVYVPAWERRDRPEYLVRTTGVIAALRVIGTRSALVLAGLVALFPAVLRDTAYRVIGRWRYRVFGPWRPRPLPRVEWSAQFLD